MKNTKTAAFGKFIAFTLIVILCFPLCACFHVHDFENGECKSCGEICEHVKYVNGVCKNCGLVCEHETLENGECTVCDFVCEHETYENGECKVCGLVCAHPIYQNGVCVDCGAVCSHENYVDGVCDVCGLVCKHESYTGDICDVCGTKCVHDYVDGVCSSCHTVCTHPSYVNGSCAVCGKPYDYAPHISKIMPRITISTADKNNDWASLQQNFDMGNLSSKDNRPYNDCQISVSNCEDKHELSNIDAQVKIRGNYTANYPKKPFRIKFTKKQAMLGLNDDNKYKNWVLLAEWKDNSHLRNSVAYYLGNQILGADGYYCTDFRLVELYLNETYWGVYLLAEQQEVNANRIDITEPEKNYVGTDIGYYIEFDGYYNFEAYSQRFSCNHNDYAQLTTRGGWGTTCNQVGYTIKSDVYYEGEGEAAEQACAQKHFIKNYINNLYKLCYDAVYNNRYCQFNADYTALVSYTPTAKTASEKVFETVSKVVDTQSLVDTYIINEMLCDADIGWSSFCMDVDFGAGSDKLLRFESPWDFDSAIGLKDNLNGAKSMYAANSSNPWLIIFINQDWFWNAVCAKWAAIRNANIKEKTLALIDALELNYKTNFQANDDKWGFQVDFELCWEAKQASNITQTIAYLRDWVQKRFTALDGFYNYKG